jgi:hypothetical protein
MKEFQYNSNLSHEENFNRWLSMNNKEREEFKQKPRTAEEGKKVFDSMYKDPSSWRLGTIWEKKNAK